MGKVKFTIFIYTKLKQSPRWGVRGAKPLEAGSILAAEGPLEKAFCLFWGEFRTLETTRLDGSYLHVSSM